MAVWLTIVICIIAIGGLTIQLWRSRSQHIQSTDLVRRNTSRLSETTGELLEPKFEPWDKTGRWALAAQIAAYILLSYGVYLMASGVILETKAKDVTGIISGMAQIMGGVATVFLWRSLLLPVRALVDDSEIDVVYDILKRRKKQMQGVFAHVSEAGKDMKELAGKAAAPNSTPSKNDLEKTKSAGPAGAAAVVVHIDGTAVNSNNAPTGSVSQVPPSVTDTASAQTSVTIINSDPTLNSTYQPNSAVNVAPANITGPSSYTNARQQQQTSDSMQDSTNPLTNITIPGILVIGSIVITAIATAIPGATSPLGILPPTSSIIDSRVLGTGSSSTSSSGGGGGGGNGPGVPVPTTTTTATTTGTSSGGGGGIPIAANAATCLCEQPCIDALNDLKAYFNTVASLNNATAAQSQCVQDRDSRKYAVLCQAKTNVKVGGLAAGIGSVGYGTGLCNINPYGCVVTVSAEEGQCLGYWKADYVATQCCQRI
ncbi:hypothetical protein HDU76_012865 [Blyttiomyces sp. JEL0837]|nr:hypothetical protein HDU76_012865 [Blyttiomyces sp. JEL0837]